MTNEGYRARYAYLRRTNRCTMCGKKDERTLTGRSRCAACAAYGKAYYKGYRKCEEAAIRRLLDEYKERARRMEEAEVIDYQALALIYQFIRQLDRALKGRRQAWKPTQPT